MTGWNGGDVLQLQQDGWRQRSIAAAWDVSERAVSRWLTACAGVVQRRCGPDHAPEPFPS